MQVARERELLLRLLLVLVQSIRASVLLVARVRVLSFSSGLGFECSALVHVRVQVLCFITAGVSRIIPPQPPASFVFVSSVIIVCALLSLVLLFGPKLYFVATHGGIAGAVADDRRLAALEAHQRDEERRCLAIADENALLAHQVTDVHSILYTRMFALALCCFALALTSCTK